MYKILAPIDPVVSNAIANKQMYVMRDSKSHTALNCSYTPEGLYWTVNPSGRLAYFKNARFQHTYKDGELHLKIVGDTRPSDKVYIEKFVPRNQSTTRGQVAEYTYTAKAQQLLRNHI